MKKVAFIGSYDKADMIICIAKLLTIMKKKVIVIDATALSKTRYIVPTMQSSKQYITTYENVDVAIGFENFEQIKAYSSLSKTDELRRDLLANVSHDLKTPLTMIKAYAEMVRDISYKDDEKRDEHLNIIISETDRLNILVNDLLNLSKMQADADTLKKENFDLTKEIKEIIKKYEIIKETENYIFQIEVPEKAIIYADKNKINQVIYNLINNAINYTGEDKTVTIRMREEKNKYIIEISDTGKGIKKEEIDLIWNKYYKNEKNHKRNIVGTGIGLSIVKTILEHHHFEYGVNSIKNKGTTFYFKVEKAKKKK